MSRRGVTVIGLTAVGGVGYYLFKAGGDPKIAEKQAEHDAARLSSAVRNELPGKGKEVKTEAKVIGQKINEARSKSAELEKNLNSYASDAEKRFEAARKEAGKELNQAVDKFDKTVGDAASKIQQEGSKAKSGLLSWFGGK
ncbi:hypothetical protein BDZ85DRAFT_97831 [Elsinoe ampelina]|uniref:Calcofluor white hypersensitive protein n=1 Tax=Elsinoe ampelina TaxID=302913 RepID=A0A6A6GEJ9_9PEZI|nr:hypothetical protein BDZ85DRAFT_97831 [Elsinoe ampelina]